MQATADPMVCGGFFLWKRTAETVRLTISGLRLFMKDPHSESMVSAERGVTEINFKWVHGFPKKSF